jgi:acid stress-induced BolA-like protein IbaG/YrbA
MVTPESIKSTIEQGLTTSYLTVVGDGQHFEAIIVSEEFAGMSRIQRQQRVNRALGNRMTTDIHALSMKTFTLQEWQEKK